MRRGYFINVMVVQNIIDIVKINSNDNILAAKSGGALSQFLNGIGIASSNGSRMGGGNISHSGGMNINISGTIQIQDPNGNTHNWDNLTNNPQFVSQITDKISMEITKKMSHSQSGDGRLIYGGYSRGMFG